jgi:hypothetical protein
VDVYAQTVSNRQLTGGVPQTVVQLVTPGGLRAQLTKLKIAFDGVSSTAEPVDVSLVNQDSAGTSSAGTVGKIDPAAPTANCSTRVSFSSTEPNYSNEVWRDMVHPQAGSYECNWQIGDPTAPRMAVSSRLALVCNAPADVKTSVTFQWAE